MANVTNLMLEVVKAPTGLWAIILNWIESSVVNYGWVIILFTLLIKACLSPMDLLIKFSTKKTTLVQTKLAPQIGRINKKYANDKQQAQMQTQALYKKEGYNVFGSCIVTLVNLVVTMVVFFTLFASLREMSAYKAINQYAEMENAYMSTLEVGTKETFITNLDTYLAQSGESYETKYKSQFEGNPETAGENNLLEKFFSRGGIPEKIKEGETEVDNPDYLFLANEIISEDATSGTKTLKSLLEDAVKANEEAAGAAATKVWQNVKDSWLWIGNIWVKDNYKSPLPSYADLKSMADSSKIKSYSTYVKNIDQRLYNTITSAVHSKVNRWNGYYILAVLSAGLTFLSQWVSERMTKSKNKNVNKMTDQTNPQSNAMKYMKIFLPIMMVIFVLTSSAAFGLYIVSSSIISILISVITSLIVNACYKKKEEEIIVGLEKEALRSMKKNKK